MVCRPSRRQRQAADRPENCSIAIGLARRRKAGWRRRQRVACRLWAGLPDLFRSTWDRYRRSHLWRRQTHTGARYQPRETSGGEALGSNRYFHCDGIRFSSGRLRPAPRMTMKLKTTPFDPADFLDTKESQIELLADAVETGDSRYIANALGTIARARGMAKVAQEAGLTRQALYRSLSKTGDPRLTTLLGVAKSLGLKLSFKAA